MCVDWRCVGARLLQKFMTGFSCNGSVKLQRIFSSVMVIHIYMKIVKMSGNNQRVHFVCDSVVDFSFFFCTFSPSCSFTVSLSSSRFSFWEFVGRALRIAWTFHGGRKE